MKKFRFLSALTFVLALTLTGCSSGSDGDSTNGGGAAGGGGANGGTAVYNGNDKQFLDQVGQQLVASFGKNDFDNFSLIRLVLEDNRYRNSVIEDHYSDVTEELKELVSSSGNYTYYKTMLVASNYYGTFDASSGRWQYSSNGSGAQFIFPDANGQQVVVTATASGNAKRIYVLKDRKRSYGYTYNPASGYYEYSSREENNEIGVAIPERVEVTATQGGQTIISATATFNLTNVTENQVYDLSRNCFDVTAKVVINNKYTVNVSQVQYNANGMANASFSISNGSNTIATGQASGNTSITNDGYDDIYVNSATGIAAQLDILGSVQVKGQCSDGIALRDRIDEADSWRNDESRFKTTLNTANSLYSANVFYNNTADVRATLSLEAFGEQMYSYNLTTGSSTPHTRWESKPVIKFTSDGAQYAFDQYFTDTEFPTVWNNFKELVNTVAENFTDDRVIR